MNVKSVQPKNDHVNFNNSIKKSATSQKKIIVCIRKKPIESIKDIVSVYENNLVVHDRKLSYSLDDVQVDHSFSYDKVFDSYYSNLDVFNKVVKGIVSHALEGGSSSLIAYGQTGTGKTYTLLDGPNAILFESIKYALEKGFIGKISFLEIYLGNVQDCLKDKQKINIFEKDGKIFASNLSSEKYTCLEEAKIILNRGILSRTTSKTEGNNTSSRSHAVISIEFAKNKNSFNIVETGQLSVESSMVMVDLAGSERGSDRKCCSKETAAEGAEINKSLLALKECIRGIGMNSGFLPFRQCKLTQILKNSLVGQTKTCFLANISSGLKDVEHTLNTLRYADRVKIKDETDNKEKSDFIRAVSGVYPNIEKTKANEKDTVDLLKTSTIQNKIDKLELKSSSTNNPTSNNIFPKTKSECRSFTRIGQNSPSFCSQPNKLNKDLPNIRNKPAAGTVNIAFHDIFEEFTEKDLNEGIQQYKTSIKNRTRVDNFLNLAEQEIKSSLHKDKKNLTPLSKEGNIERKEQNEDKSKDAVLESCQAKNPMQNRDAVSSDISPGSEESSLDLSILPKFKKINNPDKLPSKCRNNNMNSLSLTNKEFRAMELLSLDSKRSSAKNPDEENRRNTLNAKDISENFRKNEIYDSLERLKKLVSLETDNNALERIQGDIDNILKAFKRC